MRVTSQGSKDRRWQAPLVGLLLGLMLFSATAGNVSAHANLVRSTPGANSVQESPPEEIRIWYSEAPELRFSEIQLLNPDGQKLDVLGQLRVDPNDATVVVAPLQQLPPGVYTVTWRVLSSVDGHVTAGAFAFAVGQDQVPPGGLRPTLGGLTTTSVSGPTIPGVIARWLGYLGMSLLMGGFVFYPLVARPTAAESRSTVPQRRKRRGGVLAVAQTTSDTGGSALPRTLLEILETGAGAVFVATVVGAIRQAADSAGVTPLDALGTPLFDLLSGTRYGAFFWVRLLILISIGGLLVYGHRSLRRGGALPRHWWWIGIGLSGLLLLTQSLGSHAAASPDSIVATIAQWVHLLAASAWIGGLIVLLIALLIGRRVGHDAASVPTARLVGNFSRVATVSIVALVITGLYRAVVEVADWENLFDTAYGGALLVKLGLVVPLLGLGALNLLLISRRLTSSARGPDPDVAFRPWYQRIRQTVGGEVLAVTAVLLVTAVLTSLPPSREAFGSGLVIRGQLPELRAIMVVSPGLPGLNTFDVYLRDGAGEPVTDAEKVAIIFRMVEHDMGETEAVADDIGGGHYLIQGGYISMVGTWNAELLVRRPGVDDSRLRLTVRPTAAIGATVAAPGSEPGISSRVIIGVELLVVGVLLFLAAGRFAPARPRLNWAARVVGVAIASIGTTFAIISFVGERQVVAIQNPIPADAASLTRGQLIYQNSCASCHGLTGRGDGPASAALRPRPADFRVHMDAGHTDGEIFDWVTNGVPGTAMPAFGGQLTEFERWDVINYIRSFAGKPSTTAPGPGQIADPVSVKPLPVATTTSNPTPLSAPALASPTAGEVAPLPPTGVAALMGRATGVPTPVGLAATATSAVAAVKTPSPNGTPVPAPLVQSPVSVAQFPAPLPGEVAAAGWAAVIQNNRLWISDDQGQFHSLVVVSESDGFIYDPAWHPDGQRVAYSGVPLVATPGPGQSPSLFSDSSDIWEVGRDGSLRVLVPHDTRSVRLGQPAWHPDGSSIYYTRVAIILEGDRVTGATTHIERFTLASGQRDRLVEDGLWPTISADGRSLVFVFSNFDHPPTVRLFDLATGAQRDVTDSRFIDIVSPSVSPDGRTIAFAGVVVPGSAFTPGESPRSVFAWLRDLVTSRAIAHGMEYGLWLVDADGSNPRRVGDLVFDDPVVSWDAGGQHLYVYDASGLARVDVTTAQATTIFEPGGLGGFDWLPRR